MKFKIRNISFGSSGSKEEHIRCLCAWNFEFNVAILVYWIEMFV